MLHESLLHCTVFLSTQYHQFNIVSKYFFHYFIFQGKEKTVFQEELTVPDIRPSTLKDKAAPECINDMIEDALWVEEKVGQMILINSSSSLPLSLTLLLSFSLTHPPSLTHAPSYPLTPTPSYPLSHTHSLPPSLPYTTSYPLSLSLRW